MAGCSRLPPSTLCRTAIAVSIAPGDAVVSGYIDAADHAAVGRTDGQRAIDAAEHVVPVEALLLAARQREARHRKLEHDVVIRKSAAEPVPDLALLAVGQHAGTERPAPGYALERFGGSAYQPRT